MQASDKKVSALVPTGCLLFLASLIGGVLSGYASRHGATGSPSLLLAILIDGGRVLTISSIILIVLGIGRSRGVKGFGTIETPTEKQKQRYAKAGIISFAISIVGAVFLVILVAASTAIALKFKGAGANNYLMLAGVVMFGVVLASAVGFFLGLAGVLNGERRKVLSWLGTTINAAVLALFYVLIIVSQLKK